jgi:hypothetical protein
MPANQAGYRSTTAVIAYKVWISGFRLHYSTGSEGNLHNDLSPFRDSSMIHALEYLNPHVELTGPRAG